MDLAERKARILYGQHLTSAADQFTVCRDVNGIQAQFSAAARHTLAIRTGGRVEEERLVKSWTIRGTVHLFDPADLPLYLHEGRTHYLRPVDEMEEDEHITLGRKRYFADLILERLSEGPLLREELKEACFAAGMTEEESRSVFDPWGGTLRYLAESGCIVHTVGNEKGFSLCPPFAPMGEEDARVEMARRYFSIGPASVRDASYFFGEPQREVKRWMERLPLAHSLVAGVECFWLETGQTDWPEVPACLFLGGFDQLMLGYEKNESIFLPKEYIREIFSRAGIVMAPILLRGRVSGRWKEKNGKLTLTAFGRWSEEDRRAALAAAERLWPIKKVIWEEI